MAVQINEVIVRAIISGEEKNQERQSAADASTGNISSVSKDELLELINEVLNDKKER